MVSLLKTGELFWLFFFLSVNDECLGRHSNDDDDDGYILICIVAHSD